MERNRISNVSFAVCSAGEIIILAIMVGILKGLHSDDSTENNTKAFSVLIAFSGGVWCKQHLCPSLWNILNGIQCYAHFPGSSLRNAVLG